MFCQDNAYKQKPTGFIRGSMSQKTHPQNLVERACFRYKNANLEKRKAEKRIKELEKDLERARRILV